MRIAGHENGCLVLYKDLYLQRLALRVAGRPDWLIVELQEVPGIFRLRGECRRTSEGQLSLQLQYWVATGH